LFIVDNGSEPAVRQFLASICPQGAIQDVRLLQNETNEGFPKGMNRGIRASSAPYVCLLNNDLRFTPGWLEELLAVAENHPEIGVVNPESSTFGNLPPAGMSLEAYAQQLRAAHGLYTEMGICIGFCLLIKRAVLDRLGGLSEEVERIFFEDEDFCMRAKQAGFLCVVAEASYVFHAEHKTVRRMPERDQLFARNRRWCEEKWGRRLRLAWPRFSTLRPGSPELRAWLEPLIEWARRRILVYVYAPTPQGMDAKALFRSVQLIPHANIQWRSIPVTGASWAATWKILQRQKKPFDLLAAPDARWAHRMQRLHRLHRAEVVLQQDEPRLLALWQRFRSQCSS